MKQPGHSIVEHFAPGWFASVMGTGGISIAFFAFRSVIPLASVFQMAFLVLSVLAFFVLLVPWTLRFLRYPEAVRRDLGHPVSAAFFPTMPISLLVIGIALEKVSVPSAWEHGWRAMLLALWVLGTAGILAFALLLMARFLHREEVRWESATLAWLIPPVSALLVPVLGFGLSADLGPDGGVEIFVVSLAFLGIGTVLFLFVMTAVFTRHIFYGPVPLHLTPTWTIGVAPGSVLAVSLMRLPRPLIQLFGLSHETAEVLFRVFHLGAVALWGFALFWLLLAALVNIGTHREKRLPFALSWWAYIFPNAAFVIASGALYQAVPSPIFLWTGTTVLAVLLVLWALTAVRTLVGVYRRTIFLPAHAVHASEGGR